MEITIKQAATQLGKAESTIRQWLRQGKLVGQKQGRAWTISQASLSALPAQPKRKASQASRAAKLTSQIASQVVAEVRTLLQTVLQAQATQPNQNQSQAQETEIQTLRNENANLLGKVTLLESQIQNLAKQLGELNQRPAPEPEPAKHQNQPAKPEAKPQSQAQGEAKRQPPDEAKAEKWAREHIEQWINEPCRFSKTNGRTWRELGENKGDKIEVNGKLSSPRAYLHAIESWEGGQVWAKVKAKIALELGKTDKHVDAIAG